MNEVQNELKAERFKKSLFERLKQITTKAAEKVVCIIALHYLIKERER
jgi:hypothetical protein